MRKILTLLSVLAMTALSARAQGALSFLQTDFNPASAGVAGAGAASTSLGTAYSVFGNPAAIPLASQKLDVAASYRMASPLGNVTAGAAFKAGKLGVAAGFLYGMYPSMAGASEGGSAMTAFTPSDMLFGLGLSLGIGEHLGVGANVRYGIQKLDNTTSLQALNFDVMALFKTGNLGVTAGVVALGPKVKSVGNATYALPASARVAADYVLPLDKLSVEALASFDYYLSGNVGAGVGVQAGYNDLVFLRAGFRYGSRKEDFNVAPVPTHLSLGVGGKFAGIRVDVAYQLLLAGQGGALTAGLAYAF